QIKQRLQAARDRQKSYTDVRRKPLEFQVGTISYRLELPQQLSKVHSTFYVSNLKKGLSDEPLAIPLDELHIDDKLRFVKEPVEIMDREIKRLRKSRIPIIKVRWNSKRGPEFTWEREDQFKQKYPHLFTNRASSSTTRTFHLAWMQLGLENISCIPSSINREALLWKGFSKIRVSLVKAWILDLDFGLDLGKVSSIPIVLSWVDSISSDGFLPSILLLVVIIVTVIIVVVTVILIVVVVVIVVVVFVVAIIGVVVVGGVSSMIKLSFVIIDFLRRIVL
nr:putative reverse transcriptase domain-containing protein [Tanacetum cinerariifolium]